MFDRKLGLYNRCTSQTRLPTGAPRVPPSTLHDDEVSIHTQENFSFKHIIAEPGGSWPPQHVNKKVGGANYLVVYKGKQP